jgi:hypothetical protein
MNNRLSKLRKSASALADLPVLTQTQIARRWQLDPDTVRKHLRMHNPPAAPGPWKRNRYSIAEIWRIEGVSAEQMKNPENHEALFEKLLTANDLAKEQKSTPEKIRKYAREDLLKSFRVGTNVRFRRAEVSFAWLQVEHALTDT